MSEGQVKNVNGTFWQKTLSSAVGTLMVSAALGAWLLYGELRSLQSSVSGIQNLLTSEVLSVKDRLERHSTRLDRLEERQDKLYDFRKTEK